LIIFFSEEWAKGEPGENSGTEWDTWSFINTSTDIGGRTDREKQRR
jgi:hypothetical protein